LVLDNGVRIQRGLLWCGGREGGGGREGLLLFRLRKQVQFPL